MVVVGRLLGAVSGTVIVALLLSLRAWTLARLALRLALASKPVLLNVVRCLAWFADCRNPRLSPQP